MHMHFIQLNLYSLYPILFDLSLYKYKLICKWYVEFKAMNDKNKDRELRNTMSL